MTELAYLERELAPGFHNHRFHRVIDWEEQYGADTPEYGVLSNMTNNGCYTVTIIDNAETSVMGPKEGIAHPLDIIRDHKGPALFITGGFFIHLSHYYRDEIGEPMREKKLHYTVGETTVTPNWVPINSAYGDVMKVRIMTDGTKYTSGATLNNELDMTTPDFTLVNTAAGRYQYLAIDDQGHAFDNQIWEDLVAFDVMYAEKQSAKALGSNEGPSIEVDVAMLRETGRTPRRQEDGSIRFAAGAPAHKKIRTKWAFIPANQSHGTQPNERSAFARHHTTGQITVHSYTCKRSEGLDLNSLRILVMAGVAFLGLSFDDIEEDEVWANDGGASIFQIFVAKDGKSGLLALGGQHRQKYPLEINPTKMREVPHAVRILGRRDVVQD